MEVAVDGPLAPAVVVRFLSADIPRTGPINNITTVIISPPRYSHFVCVCYVRAYTNECIVCACNRYDDV